MVYRHVSAFKKYETAKSRKTMVEIVLLTYLAPLGLNLLMYKTIAEADHINYISLFFKKVLSSDQSEPVKYYFNPNPLKILAT